MDASINEDEFSQWFSTYGLITAQRILGHYQINLPSKDLITAVKNTTSFYHQVIQVPLKIILNGIILQQASDYHVYGQKLFIDYLLSGESGKPPESQGAGTRESIEEERKALVSLGEEFNQIQIEHEAAISISQKGMIKLANELTAFFNNGIKIIHSLFEYNGITRSVREIKDSFIHALIFSGTCNNTNRVDKGLFIRTMNETLKAEDLDNITDVLELELTAFFEIVETAYERIGDYQDRVHELTGLARSFRKQFYDSVLRIVELMTMLPEYTINYDQDQVNRESLHFDKSIGETK